MRDIFLMGEVGINANGDVVIAKRLIDALVKNKWSAVKFQKRTLEKVIPKEMWDKKKKTLWGEIKYIDYKKKLEFGKKEYDEIDEYCKKKGLPWFASAWDLESQKFLDSYELEYNKIGSPMLTYEPLLEHVAEQGKTTFIATGMSTWKELDRAVEIFESNSCPFILLHCVGLYPCPLHMLNINMIDALREKYKCEVGYSGHLDDPFDALVAAAHGAQYIEKHITLDKHMYGSDQKSSIDPAGMQFIAENCRNIPIMLGHGKKVMSNKEKKVADKLRYW